MVFIMALCPCSVHHTTVQISPLPVLPDTSYRCRSPAPWLPAPSRCRGYPVLGLVPVILDLARVVGWSWTGSWGGSGDCGQNWNDFHVWIIGRLTVVVTFSCCHRRHGPRWQIFPDSSDFSGTSGPRHRWGEGGAAKMDLILTWIYTVEEEGK